MVSIVHRPTTSGKAGLAWVVTAAPVALSQTASLKSWLLFLPHQHPLWNYYQLSIVTLKDIPGTEPAHKIYPAAEYELVMNALSSETQPDPTDLYSMHPLTPLNFVGQFHGVTEEEAPKVGEGMVRHLLDNKLMAETQGIRGARDLWQTNMEFIAQSIQFARTVEGQASHG